MAGLWEESRGEESGPAHSGQRVLCISRCCSQDQREGALGLQRPTGVRYPVPAFRARHQEGWDPIRGENPPPRCRDASVTHGDATRNRIRWETPHRDPLDTFLTLRSCYLCTEMWPTSYSIEETEKKQASLEANHFAIRP